MQINDQTSIKLARYILALILISIAMNGPPARAGTITGLVIGCPQKGEIKTMMSIMRQSGDQLAGEYAEQHACIIIPNGKQADYIEGDGWAGVVRVRPQGAISAYWVPIGIYEN